MCNIPHRVMEVTKCYCLLEGEVRKERDRVIPSDQLEKLLLITSENCQNTYGIRTQSVITWTS